MNADSNSDIQLTFEDGGAYLLAVASGNYSMQATMATFHSSIQECRRREQNNLIVDVREVHGKVSTIDRFEFGERMAQTLRNFNLRFGLYCRPDQMTAEGFLQSVMANRGARVRVDADFERIRKWLLEDPDAT